MSPSHRVQPLMGIDGHLSAEGFGQHQDVTGHGTVRPVEEKRQSDAHQGTPRPIRVRPDASRGPALTQLALQPEEAECSHDEVSGLAHHCGHAPDDDPRIDDGLATCD